jgi:enoyl-CoA hydratase/carnithine racemase
VSWTTILREGGRLLNGLLEIDVPIISAVNGPALVHAELSVLADIVLASTTARFADKGHVVMSQVPGDGSHVVWSRLLGPTRGKYFLLTGQEIDAEEALRLGVVNEVVEPAALLGRAHTLAQDLASLPLAMLQATRAVLNIDTRRSFAEDLSHGLALEAFASLSTSGGETYAPKVWNRMAL